MKKIIFILLSFITLTATAQNESIELNCVSPLESLEKGAALQASCNNFAWWYSGNNMFTANPEIYYPKRDTNHLVRLYFLIFQRADGTGNFSEDDMDILVDGFNNANNRITNWYDPVTDPADDCFLEEQLTIRSSILYHLEDVVFIKDDFYHDNGPHVSTWIPGPNCYIDSLIQYMHDTTACDKKGIYIAFTNNDSLVRVHEQYPDTAFFNGIIGANAGQFPTAANFDRASYIHHPDRYIKHLSHVNFPGTGVWNTIGEIGAYIPHEVGHNLGLYHTCWAYGV